jgi:hypothetical protein
MHARIGTDWGASLHRAVVVLAGIALLLVLPLHGMATADPCDPTDTTPCEADACEDPEDAPPVAEPSEQASAEGDADEPSCTCEADEADEADEGGTPSEEEATPCKRCEEEGGDVDAVPACDEEVPPGDDASPAPSPETPDESEASEPPDGSAGPESPEAPETPEAPEAPAPQVTPAPPATPAPTDGVADPSPRPAPTGPGPTSGAPTGPGPTSGAPTGPGPTSGAPTGPGPTSGAPTGPGPTSGAPTGPAPPGQPAVRSTPTPTPAPSTEARSSGRLRVQGNDPIPLGDNPLDGVEAPSEPLLADGFDAHEELGEVDLLDVPMPDVADPDRELALDEPIEPDPIVAEPRPLTDEPSALPVDTRDAHGPVLVLLIGVLASGLAFTSTSFDPDGKRPAGAPGRRARAAARARDLRRSLRQRVRRS